MTRPIPLLDSREEMAKIDVENVLGSIEMLASQVQQIWDEAKKIQVEANFKDIDNVVVAGMGGSVLGTHVIQSIFKDEIKVPVLISPDYTVPHFVNERTLVIASSYSGTTEETLAAVADAEQKGAKICGITSGGPLAEFLRSKNYPALVFDPIYNPCNQPRMALGYSIFGQIALFARAGVISITETEYQNALNIIAQVHLECGANVPQDSNPAKILAFEMKELVPVIVAAEHLEGNAHVFANQINENAKTYSEYRVIPELNHHLMEGLQFPESNEHNLFFYLVESDLYNKSISRRFELTQEVLEKHNIRFRTHKLTGKTRFEQSFEMMMQGAYTNYYLALLNNVNPAPIPTVDWFKSQLKK